VADEDVELEVRLVADGEVAWYNDLMAEHHGLGVAASGRVLRYVAEAGGVPLVLGTFGSAAWRVPARDAFTGWDPVVASHGSATQWRMNSYLVCPPDLMFRASGSGYLAD